MKKIYVLVAFTILMSVFTVCFLIGRAMVLKNEDTPAQPIKNDGIVAIPYGKNDVKEANSNAEKVEKNTEVHKSPEENTQEERIPERMQFPCGTDILRDYSQLAIYSKTTDDWRAHSGVDYRAQKGSNVESIYDGEVTNVYEDKLWGYCVEIIHTGNILGIYRNLDENIPVKNGDRVEKGQVIGKVGESASIEKAEEPHLHFEMWMDGESINPSSFIY